MLPKSFSVNAFLRFRAPFPQVLFVLFRTGYGHRRVGILWIKRGRAGLFYLSWDIYFSLRIMPFSVASHRLLASVAEKVTCRATAR